MKDNLNGWHKTRFKLQNNYAVRIRNSGPLLKPVWLHHDSTLLSCPFKGHFFLFSLLTQPSPLIPSMVTPYWTEPILLVRLWLANSSFLLTLYKLPTSQQPCFSPKDCSSIFLENTVSTTWCYYPEDQHCPLQISLLPQKNLIFYLAENKVIKVMIIKCYLQLKHQRL